MISPRHIKYEITSTSIHINITDADLGVCRHHIIRNVVEQMTTGIAWNLIDSLQSKDLLLI